MGRSGLSESFSRPPPVITDDVRLGGGKRGESVSPGGTAQAEGPSATCCITKEGTWWVEVNKTPGGDFCSS